MTRHVLKLVTTSNRKEKANVSGQPEENMINKINNTVSPTQSTETHHMCILLQTGIPNLESRAEKVT